MTRISKQEERRHRCPHKRKAPAKKTGPLKDNLPLGFKDRPNAVEGELAQEIYIAKLN